MLRRSITSMRRRTGTRVAAAVATFGLLATITGCGLGGSDDEDSAGGDGTVETSQLTVSTLPSIDVAPLRLAVDEGYFEEEGLNVSITQTDDGHDALTELINEDSEIALSSYVPFLIAQAEGTADISFVADSVSATNDSVGLVTTPDSPVDRIEDLEHRKVAVSGTNTISDSLVKAVMTSNGADFSNVEFTSFPFPDIADALARGDADAGLLIEPFLTEAASSQGTVSIVEMITGPTEDLPLTGYGASTTFAEENPETLAAFNRALDKATDDVQKRDKIEPVVMEMTGVDKDIAALMELPEFRTRLDPTRIQRVANTLLEFRILQQDLDLEDMIVQPDT